jgi:uncharacterized metal-binding protein YceD (DUF177 family)
MPLVVNLRHLETRNLHLEGEVPVQELDLQLRDTIVRAEHPLHYAVEAQRIENELLVQGRLLLVLRCECVRCLKPFDYSLELPAWTCLLPLEGEDKALVVNDCVDLTPYLREDILLEFPQHPLCETECRGLPKPQGGKAMEIAKPGQAGQEPSAWAELDKLKL